MNFNRTIFTLLLPVLLLSIFVSAQSVEEWEMAKRFLPDREALEQEDVNHKQNPSKENVYVFSGLYQFYKAFVSSQDGQSCSFHPSCSTYGLQAMKKHGSFLGALMGFDRLTRCHGLSPHWYEFDRKKRLLIDPVE